MPDKVKNKGGRPKKVADVGTVDLVKAVSPLKEEAHYPVKEIIVEKIVEVEVIKEVEIEVERTVYRDKEKLVGFKLYKSLKEAGYPQGGMGEWWEDPDSTEKVYVPRPEELYGHFIGDPQQWNELRDSLTRTWLEYSNR